MITGNSNQTHTHTHTHTHTQQSDEINSFGCEKPILFSIPTTLPPPAVMRTLDEGWRLQRRVVQLLQKGCQPTRQRETRRGRGKSDTVHPSRTKPPVSSSMMGGCEATKGRSLSCLTLSGSRKKQATKVPQRANPQRSVHGVDHVDSLYSAWKF